MASGDIWFLLIFIILPTAILVSGFWAFLFVRRDPRKTIPRQRQTVAESKSTREDIEETVQVATVPPPTLAETEAVADEPGTEGEAEGELDQPLAGPTTSELAPDDDQVVEGPDPTDVQPEEDEPSPNVEEGETDHASHQIADEQLVELVDVDDRDDLIAEIQRRQPAQTARLESSTDEIPNLGDAVMEPARLSDTADDYDEWRPRPEAAPEDMEDEVADGWEISEDELEGDVEDEEPGQATGSASDRQASDDDQLSDEEDDTDANGEEDETDNRNETPSASSGDNPRRSRRQRRRVRLTPSDNGERQGRRGGLLGRRKSQTDRTSRRDEGGM